MRADALYQLAILKKRTGAKFGRGFEGKNQHIPAFYRSRQPLRQS
jgi:hypothetical protein